MTDLLRRIPMLCLLVAGTAIPCLSQDRADIVIADFEGAGYGGWVAAGEAFGATPAKGTLPGQMPVTGFQGKQLVNSFLKGDGSTGTLTSPPIKLERKFLNFLVGGGGYPDETCLQLLIDGKIVRTATGPNTNGGGSEALEWTAWDVAEFAGKPAVIKIVDARTGGWGHINVDHIVQSDRSRGVSPRTREVKIAQPYLQFPVRTGAPKRVLKIRNGDEVLHEFEIELADGEPELWVFTDVAPWRGQTVTLECKLPEDSRALDAVHGSDVAIEGPELYRERLRPQFHFTSRRGWLNDPNGLVYFDGEYHLFYQHNPYGVNWGNMHWGHAVSPDLVHWKELGIGLYPKKFGDWAFSGSAVVDIANTSGWGKDGQPPLVLAYTSTGRGECIAWSNDKGRTWTEFDGNPVVKHTGRDPRLLWHAASRQWVMAVYTEAGPGLENRFIAFHTSPDLKNWTYRSRIAGFYECPDLVELPVIGGAPDERKWILYGADGQYLVGRFDGQTFEPESAKQRLWHGNFYAAQTFTNTPGGRCVQIGWGSGITFPGMPFNQQMVAPVELTLHRTGDHVALRAAPAAELATLRGQAQVVEVSAAKVGTWTAPVQPQDGFELVLRLIPARTGDAGLNVRGLPIRYSAEKQELTVAGKTASLPLDGETLDLRVLTDRGSVEVFAEDGRAAFSVLHVPPEKQAALELVLPQGASLKSLTAYDLKSAWGR